ncbi:MAG: STAS domain-containing protein, partial [Betaproteobacteria bacterium]|nr:STAS domain-containing protein [Betaproteobacteria bacterium]
MTAIIQNEKRWDVTGDIGMDNANSLLVSSKRLTLTDEAVIDFAKVGEVDTSTVSLMLEWQRRAVAENKQITFVNLPKNLTSLTALYGVT